MPGPMCWANTLTYGRCHRHVCMHTPGVVGVDENILRVQHDKHIVLVERTIAGPQKCIHRQPL